MRPILRCLGLTWSLLVVLQLPTDGVQRLGTVRFATSCRPAVSNRFNRAVALLHSFAFSLAVAEFNAVLQADSTCAMAHWGLALSAWGNPFAAGTKSPAQLARGSEAVSRARRSPPPTARERQYLEAVAQLYDHADSLDQPTRLLRYRDAMAKLAAAEPADTEAAIFHALAIAISADPTDKSYASQLAAGATFERLFKALPDHPGLAHYIIHSYDVPPLARRALAAAHRYGRIAPSVSHALHMPSHTYTRVGSWQESITANVASAAAARREGAVAEELHSADYRTYAYLQSGQDSAAAHLVAAAPAIAARLDPNAIGTGGSPAAGYYAIAAIPARYALERGDWKAAARLEIRSSPFPFAEAVTWFARGLGAAHLGDTAAARQAIAALERLRGQLAEHKESYWGEQVEIQRQGILAWLAVAQRDRQAALSLMRAAAEREAATEKNAITPGPLAPARELLGDMLLELRQPGEALAAYRATLEHEPNRYHALTGAAKAAMQRGDRATAREYYRKLLQVCARADQPGRAELVEARRIRSQDSP